MTLRTLNYTHYIHNVTYIILHVTLYILHYTNYYLLSMPWIHYKRYLILDTLQTLH